MTIVESAYTLVRVATAGFSQPGLRQLLTLLTSAGYRARARCGNSRARAIRPRAIRTTSSAGRRGTYGGAVTSSTQPGPPQRLPVPAPAPARRRDRHGRGLRGPLLPPILPAWRTRAELFDELVTSAADDLARDWPQVARIQFAVEEVPPSDPAPWERGAVLGRGFAAEPRAGLPARVVVYRRPVTSRTADEEELADLVRRVVVEQVALMLGRRPEEIDPDIP